MRARGSTANGTTWAACAARAARAGVCTVVVVMVAVVCTAVGGVASASATDGHPRAWASAQGEGDVAHEWLVMLDGYMMHEDAVRLLEGAGAGAEGERWRVVWRRAPQARHLPTDFVVVHTPHAATLATLSQHERVRAVHAQRGSVFAGAEPARALLRGSGTGRGRSATAALNAERVWRAGARGDGVRVAIFDTGLRRGHPHFERVRERTNWTSEHTLEDGVGHGTFVAGVVASSFHRCPGISPDVDLYIFRVFTNGEVSYTSWFLDAFNYALLSGIDVLNLSIGGPDAMDAPFVDKVNELTANGVIVVSAIGNDGPVYGTLNNPADMMDVLGVGGIDFAGKVMPFSSRGMTTWGLPYGHGQPKPDVVTFASRVLGSSARGVCVAHSGTSYASPVAAGAVALLVSAMADRPHQRAWVNPASVKQVLMETAVRVPKANVFEQGAGKISLTAAYDAMRAYTPHVSATPPVFDLTNEDYMWPYSAQPLYATAMPVTLNATLLNGAGVLSFVEGAPEWIVRSGGGEVVRVSCTHSQPLWPWSGFLAMRVDVAPSAHAFRGVVSGVVRVTVRTPRGVDVDDLVSVVEIGLAVRVVPTPPREKRVLWDQFHSLAYPGSGYLPRDTLQLTGDQPRAKPDWSGNVLDWNGDHIHTNFRDMFNYIRRRGYFVEVLQSDLTCFDARLYGTLLLVDSEDVFSPHEVVKLEHDVRELGLSLFVAADWYNERMMRRVHFFDNNTHKWWSPWTGGANVPALNALLRPFGIAFGDRIFYGKVQMAGQHRTFFSSGVALARFPRGGYTFATVLGDQTAKVLDGHSTAERVKLLGLHESGAGRVAVYGDASCLDSAHLRTDCFWLLERVLAFTMEGEREGPLAPLQPLRVDYTDGAPLPPLRMSRDFVHISRVLGAHNAPRCWDEARFAHALAMQRGAHSAFGWANETAPWWAGVATLPPAYPAHALPPRGAAVARGGGDADAVVRITYFAGVVLMASVVGFLLFLNQRHRAHAPSTTGSTTTNANDGFTSTNRFVRQNIV